MVLRLVDKVVGDYAPLHPVKPGVTYTQEEFEQAVFGLTAIQVGHTKPAGMSDFDFAMHLLASAQTHVRHMHECEAVDYAPDIFHTINRAKFFFRRAQS